MPQYLKDEVEERIGRAALAVFAKEGFARATMAGVAREAGVSTGNIYRYVQSKERLFEVVVPDAFVRTLARLLRSRAEALRGVADVKKLPRGSRYPAISEELLAFSIDNRLRVVVLLGRAEGTKHAGFAERMVHALAKLAVAHFRHLDPEIVVTDAMRFDLLLFYRAFVAAMVAILARFEDPAAIRAAVDAYTRYHLAGLKAFFS